MPKIEQFGASRVQSQVARQPRASANLPRGSFGESVTKGLEDIGLAAANMRQRIDTTEAEEATVQFERDKNKLLYNPENGYFNTQGRNAFDGSEAASKAMVELKKKYQDGLSTENAKKMFGDVADKHLIKGDVDIMRHASGGLKAWEVATVQAQVENTVENAALMWNDPESLRVQNALGRQAVIDASEMQGIGGEAMNEKLQTFDSAFARTAIAAATASSSVEGQVLLDEMSGRLEGPDKLKLEKDITAKAKAEKTQADAQFAVVKAGALVRRHDNRQGIIDEVNTIDDPERRKKTMSESMHQFNLQKQANSEARAASFEDAESHIIGDGSAESFRAEDPEGWARLSTKQQRSIESGKAVITDWNTFSELMVMPREKLAKVDPTEHFHRLAPAERSKLISAVKSASGTGTSTQKIDHQVGRTRSAQTTAAVEQIFGKKTKLDDEKRVQVNGFYDLVDQEVAFREQAKGSALSSEEYTNLLSGLTREVVQEGFIFDTDLDITDIPAEDIPAVSRFLRDNNIPVTSDNLIKAHQQATQ